MKKICTKCKDEKDLPSFNKNKTKRDGYNNICRICSNTSSKKYYELNKPKHKEMVKIRRNRVVDENRKMLFKYLSENHCVDCGNDNPIVLELDHRDSVNKRACVSEMMQLSWGAIQNEIDKCDVRCSNCHKIRTAKQFGWYKWLND